MIVKETGFKIPKVNIMVANLSVLEGLSYGNLTCLEKYLVKDCEILEHCLHNEAGKGRTKIIKSNCCKHYKSQVIGFWLLLPLVMLSKCQ